VRAAPACGLLGPADAGAADRDPQRAGGLDRGGHLLGVRDVALDEARLELLGERRTLLGVQIGDRDLGARGAQPAGGGGAEP
jgi:hypothetical protein